MNRQTRVEIELFNFKFERGINFNSFVGSSVVGGGILMSSASIIKNIYFYQIKYF